MIESFFESFANVALAVLGISFLIFIHEAGHFLAARLFDVRVETFSIGFGPRLFGWRRRGTDYRISAVPLGGYVKMAGEYGDLPDDEEPDPGDLMAKPIWQRLVIFSAGVIVNIAFAFVLFPVAFGAGVPFLAPVVGEVAPGGPAWRAGLQPGDEVLAVNGRKVWGFEDLTLEVALADPDELVLQIQRDGRAFEQPVVAESTDGHYSIGIAPPALAELEVDPEYADRPDGVRSGDRLLAAGDYRVGALHHGERLTAPQALRLARGLYGSDTLPLLVERDGRELRIEHRLHPLAPPPDARRMLGALALQNKVAALRGADPERRLTLRPGDVILGAPGHPVWRPTDLHALAERGAPLELRVQRGDEELELTLGPQDIAAIRAGDVALESHSATRRFLVPDGGALARAGLRDGDELLALDGRPMADFDALLEHLRAHPDQVDHELRYRRDGSEHTVAVRAEVPPLLDLGFGLRRRDVVHDLGFTASLHAGFDACLNALRNTGVTLGKLFTGEVSADNLGGPVAISQITYQSAKMDIAKLIFFLAILSVNLGVINILPIPVLDGGQIMFLLFEKVKGSRLSDRFLQNAQLTGLVAILALMVYVTFNDLSRLVG